MFNSKRRRRERQRQEAKELLMATQSFYSPLQPNAYWSLVYSGSEKESGSKVPSLVEMVTVHSASSPLVDRSSTVSIEVCDLLTRARKPEIVKRCVGCQNLKDSGLGGLVAHYNDAHCRMLGCRPSVALDGLDTAEEWWTRALELTL